MFYVPVNPNNFRNFYFYKFLNQPYFLTFNSIQITYLKYITSYLPNQFVHRRTSRTYTSTNIPPYLPRLERLLSSKITNKYKNLINTIFIHVGKDNRAQSTEYLSPQVKIEFSRVNFLLFVLTILTLYPYPYLSDNHS